MTPNVMPVYTYTGNHQMLDDGNGHWRIKFLSSGVLEWLSPDTEIDVFLVGGGGAGGQNGGGGGYTKTAKKISLNKNSRHQVIVGAGAENNFNYYDTPGGSSSFDDISVSGGKGMDGGSGGGGWSSRYRVSNPKGGDGGTDGGDGEYGHSDVKYGDNGAYEGALYTTNKGKGQGTTTREFGDAGADLYSGGGAGPASVKNGTMTGSGGTGGLGSPVIATVAPASHERERAGSPGGGYGGGCGGDFNTRSGYFGAQGIVIIRDAR